ncbi:MAG: undecaprenyl-diphosphate phosphatase [Bacteroidia bacterium]|jgi:undecaprenyl-diphosphatase
MTTIEAVILAIVEGITEFLPISSTGHMILVSSMMGNSTDHFVKMFTVAIQFGAILSVIALYWKRFFQTIGFYFKLFVAFIPAAVIGYLFNDQIDAMLESALVVAIALLIGGIVLLFIDKWMIQEEKANDEVTYKKAFLIGVFQIIAMIPGVSRSAATIIGGLQQKLSRKAAAEFSFFLAVPTMFAATIYKMYKYHDEVGFQMEDVSILIVGNMVAFVVALIAIKGFIAYLTKHGFRIFGWYRIIVGVIILGLYAAGINLEVI